MNIFFQGVVLLMFATHTPPSTNSKPRVHEVLLHAYPLSSSTVTGVDTVQIQNSAPLKTRLKSPARFVARLEQSLSKRDTLSLTVFKSNFVRFWFRVSYDDGTVRSIYLSQGSSLLVGQRLYKLDSGLKELIREYIPDKDEYLLVRPKK